MVIVHCVIAVIASGHCTFCRWSDGQWSFITYIVSLQWDNGHCTLWNCGDSHWSLYTVPLWWWPVVIVHCIIAVMASDHSHCLCSDGQCNALYTVSLRWLPMVIVHRAIAMIANGHYVLYHWSDGHRVIYYIYCLIALVIVYCVIAVMASDYCTRCHCDVSLRWWPI